MPKLRKEDLAGIDVDELENAEYTEGTFTSYSGEIPPEDTVLIAYVKSMWWSRTANNDAMLKVLVEASDNVDDDEEYNGLPMWENMALTTGAKFKWAPFLEHFGLSIRDIKQDAKSGKSKVVLAPEDDNVGAPIEKIADFTPGSDESWCRVITSREKYDGKWQAHVKGWLEYEEPEEQDDEDEPEEDEEEPEEEEEQEEEDTEDEEEPEPEPEPAPTRGRRTAGKQAAKTASKGRTPSAAASTRTTGRKAATGRSGAAKSGTSAAPPRRGKGRAVASDEPPF